MKNIESAKKKRKKKADTVLNGMVIAKAVQNLQEEKGKGEKISFDEIYEKVNQVIDLSKDAVVENLGRWATTDFLERFRGKLWVYKKNKNGEYEEFEMSETYMYGNERKSREEQEREDRYRSYKTAFFVVEPPEEKYKYEDNRKTEEDRKKEQKEKRRIGNNSANEVSEGKDCLKSQCKDYADIIIEALKKHVGDVGNGLLVNEKVEEYLEDTLALDGQSYSNIDSRTIFRYLLKLLNPKNKKILDFLNIEVGFGVEYKQKGKKSVEYMQLRHRADCDPDEVKEFDFDNPDNNLRDLRKSHIQVCDKSEVWDGEWTLSWAGSEDCPYMDFVIKRYRKGETYAISYGVLKFLCNNEGKTEGMTRKEIKEGLFQFIPDIYIERKEFDAELDEAFTFMEEEKLAKQVTEGHWVLGDRI